MMRYLVGRKVEGGYEFCQGFDPNTPEKFLARLKYLFKTPKEVEKLVNEGTFIFLEKEGEAPYSKGLSIKLNDRGYTHEDLTSDEIIAIGSNMYNLFDVWQHLTLSNRTQLKNVFVEELIPFPDEKQLLNTYGTVDGIFCFIDTEWKRLTYELRRIQ